MGRNSTKQTSSYAPRSYNKEFALFRFNAGSLIDYGWLELSLDNGIGGPTVSILGYAYDNTGERIRAGAIPEPKHLPLAMGALALGAIGLREWRAKRGATAAGDKS